jgi:succinate-semialdehyde dehydrogenase / glutarate-semialdehyde dehydrogenase
MGGSRHPLGGNFFEPTIIMNVNESMEIFCTEIFGPIVTVIEFNNTDEVIRMANDTSAGLASYFYTNDMEMVWKVAENLEYGMVGINSGIIASAAIPFGGVKESGFGREGSRYGIDDYVTIKYVHLRTKS